MARNSLKNVCRLIESAKITLPPEEDFLNDLKRSIELTDQKNRRVPSQTYKPSGMNCIRQSYYQIMGVQGDEGTSNYTMIGICETGTDRHERVQQAVLNMKENGMECEYINVADFVRKRELTYLDIVKEPDFEHGEFETKLYHKVLNISFLCDGIIKYHNHYYILEIKTEGSSKFFARKGVDISHYNQATAYSLSLGIDEVIFVYISRDTLEMKAYLFNVTDTMKHDLVGYIETCDGYLKQLKVPPKPEDVAKKTCTYCQYAEQCRKDG